MKATELDRRFDDGEDVSDVIDWTSARRINQEPRRVNVDFPAWSSARVAVPSPNTMVGSGVMPSRRWMSARRSPCPRSG